MQWTSVHFHIKLNSNLIDSRRVEITLPEHGAHSDTPGMKSPPKLRNSVLDSLMVNHTLRPVHLPLKYIKDQMN